MLSIFSIPAFAFIVLCGTADTIFLYASCWYYWYTYCLLLSLHEFFFYSLTIIIVSWSGCSVGLNIIMNSHCFMLHSFILCFYLLFFHSDMQKWIPFCIFLITLSDSYYAFNSCIFQFELRIRTQFPPFFSNSFISFF